MSKICAIDGTPNTVINPSGPSKAEYVNRNSYHSVYLHAVSKLDASLTDIKCGWPGRVNEARVFNISDMCRFQAQLCGKNHSIGDKAYPIPRFPMNPYRESPNILAEKVLNKIKYNDCENALGIVC